MLSNGGATNPFQPHRHNTSLFDYHHNVCCPSARKERHVSRSRKSGHPGMEGSPPTCVTEIEEYIAEDAKINGREGDDENNDYQDGNRVLKLSEEHISNPSATLASHFQQTSGPLTLGVGLLDIIIAIRDDIVSHRVRNQHQACN